MVEINALLGEQKATMKVSEEVKLYILSLSILFLIVLVMTLNVPDVSSEIVWSKVLKSNWLPLTMLALMFYSYMIHREFEYALKGGVGDSLRVCECKSENYEHLTFLATYIIPFFGFNFDDPRRLIAYLFLLVVIGVIFVKTDKYYANPTLAVLGYKLYRATLADANNRYESVVIISQCNVSTGQLVNYKLLSRGIFFVKGC